MSVAADRVLRAELGLSYRRAIILLVVEDSDGLSQRAIARKLGHAEASVSTLVRDLVNAGALSVELVDRRERRVRVTEDGSRLVARARALTEPMFQELVMAAGVDVNSLGRQLKRLDDVLAATR
jgi:DNA-binding MarR family transcriptional regulator